MTQPHENQAFLESEIANRASELGLTIPKEKIRVRKSDGRIIMDVQLTVPLDLYVYRYEWRRKLYLDHKLS